MTRHDDPRNTENPAHPDDTNKKETPVTENTEGTTPAEPLARTLLGVPEGHGVPHHDADRIKADDFVMQVDRCGVPTAGIASHRDSHGNWQSENGYTLVSVFRLAERPDALTIWPAPTPPAEEVEMPTEHPAHLLDVVVANGDVCPYMALDRDGYWTGVSAYGKPVSRDLHHIVIATLPDGTRARRDGNRPDGKPRFVKLDQ